MGRSDLLDGQARRAHERIEKALARRDPEAALEALLSIPAAARDELVPPAAALVHRSAEELRRQGAWGRLHVLAARAESEPRLLAPAPADGAAGEPATEARWALLLACLHARDWARGRRYLSALAPLLEARGPALGRALAAWIERAGDLGSEAPALPSAGSPATPAPDPRLGYDPPARKRAPVPVAPATAEQVEAQVLALAATQPFLTFAETVLEWSRKAQPQVARALALAATPLAVRELLLALDRHGSPAEAALLLGRLARPHASDEGVATELLLGTRLALPALAREPLNRTVGLALGELAAASSRRPEGQTYVIEWLTADDPDAGARPAWLCVAEALLGTDGGAALEGERRLRLWAAGLMAWERGHAGQAESPRQPPWLQATNLRVLEDPAAVGAFLGALSPERRRPLLVGVVESAPVRAAAAVLASCWERADERQRDELASLAAALMNHAQDEAMEGGLLDQIGDRTFVHSLNRALAAGLEGLVPFGPQARAVWRTIGERAMRHDPDLLAWALSDAPGPAEARASVATYLEGKPHVEARLEAIRAIASTERDDLTVLMHEVALRMLSDFAADAPSLARALRWSHSRGAPRHLVQAIAVALLEEVARNPPPSPPPPWTDQIAVAAKLAGKKAPGRRRGRGVGAAKDAAPRAPRTKKSNAQPEARRPPEKATTKAKAPPEVTTTAKATTRAKATTKMQPQPDAKAPPNAETRDVAKPPPSTQLGLPFGGRAS
jgi:hypothetical protein